MRVWKVYALIGAAILAGPEATSAQMLQRIASGPNAAAIQAAVDQFRADLGGGNVAGPHGSFGGVRREVNWDAVSDTLASPADFPEDFFNTTSPRGVLFRTFFNGTLRVSQDDNTPNDVDPDLVRFSDINASHAAQFQAFSDQRIAGIVGDGDSVTLVFRLPATDTPAVVRGVGVVFTGVDSINDDHFGTHVTLFDPSGELLASVDAPPGAMSFVGLSAPTARVAFATITLGTAALDGGPEVPGITDISAFDDVIFAEPELAKEVLPEGATGSFFDTELAIANPTGNAQTARLEFFKEDGTTFTLDRIIPARARVTLPLDTIPGLEATAFSTVITPQSGEPLGVERTMFWGTNRYGGHTGNSVSSLSTRWLFAEGAQGFFDAFYLVTNENNAPATVTFTFLREQDSPFVVVREVAAHARLTLYAGAFPELTGRSFGLEIGSTQPIGAERSMYFGSTPNELWKGGHESPGVRGPLFNWYYAEGSTGAFWDTFILLANPHDVAVPVTVTFLRESGSPIVRQKVLGPKQRLTINPEFEAQELEHTSVATQVNADMPIVAERSMYWTGSDGQPWTEGHSSLGQNFPTFAHLFAEGRVGGPEKFRTFLLLTSINPAPTPVKLTFFRENGLPTVSKTLVVNSNSRYTFDVGAEMPELQNERFGVFARSNGGGSFLIERSIYWDAGDAVFAGGTSGIPAHMSQTLFVP